MSEKPLNVQVAECIGTSAVRCAAGFIEDANSAGYDFEGWICSCGARGTHPAPDAHATPVPPYGDDTPEGWACTGPLLARFGLTVFGPRLEVEEPDPRWYAAVPDSATLGEHGATACEAIARLIVRLHAEGRLPR